LLHERILSPEAQDEGALARVVAAAATHAEAVDREGRFPHEAVAAMRAEGLLGAMVPVELGGQGADVATICRQTQAIARACASSAMIYAMHHSQLVAIVDFALHQPWHRDFARRIAAEQLLIASITSEVGIGGNARNSTCFVEPVDGGIRLAKQAPTVSYGREADVFLVTARAHAQAAVSDQVLVAITRDQARFEDKGEWDALGMRGTGSVAFTFEGQGLADQVNPVPFAEISADGMVPASHLMWCAAWTGIAMEATAKARKFLREQARKMRGATPPGATRLVRIAADMEAMRARIAPLIAQYDAQRAGAANSGWPAGMARAALLNTLKIDVSETAHEVVLEALRICGMAGYKNGTPFSIGRHLRDILSAQLMINNDRIAGGTGTLLLAQRGELGEL
jgi:acyl-CoA dehydrogenase